MRFDTLDKNSREDIRPGVIIGNANTGAAGQTSEGVTISAAVVVGRAQIDAGEILECAGDGPLLDRRGDRNRDSRLLEVLDIGGLCGNGEEAFAVAHQGAIIGAGAIPFEHGEFRVVKAAVMAAAPGDTIVVAAPPSVLEQWKAELEERFGLIFEILDRSFLTRIRRERGFGVNPWSTHTRFIVSHQTVRRPEYRDPLLQHIGERAKKSLLILDEAHVAAPASASKYAIDSRITRVIRDIAPRFENRLFLSATPHNGHSNSFSRCHKPIPEADTFWRRST